MKLIHKQTVLKRLTSLIGALFAMLLISSSVLHGATYFSEDFDTLDTVGLTNAGWQIDHNASAFETGTDFVVARYPYDPTDYANPVWPPGNAGGPGTSFFDPLTALPYVTPPGERGVGSSLTSGGYLISDSDRAGGSDNIGSLSEFWAITPSFSTLGANEVWWHADADIEANNNGECLVTLDVSVDGGSTWVQAWAQAEPQRPIKAYNYNINVDPAFEGGDPIGGYPVLGSYSQTKTWSGIHGRWHVKLPAVANNKADVKVRIRYFEPADAWWIALDNIVVDNKAPRTGGQVVLSENFANGIPATWKNLSTEQKWGTGPLTNLDGSLKMQLNAAATNANEKIHVDLLRYLDILRAEGTYTNLAPANVLNWSVTNFVDYPDHVTFHPQSPIDGYFLMMMAGGSYAMWQPDSTNHVSDLDTPTLDMSLKSEVFLDFDSEWLNRIYNANDPTLSQIFLVQVSVDGGANFTTIFDYQAALSNIGEGDYFMHHYIPVPEAAGKSNVVFRFHAEGRDNGNLLDPGDLDSGTRHQGFWAIDNVRITANSALSVQLPTDSVTTPSNTWYFLKMEGESYGTKTAADTVGFTRSFAGDARTGAHGTQILADDTQASKKAVLFTQTGFGLFADKATYYAQFARTGTYYMYMRFTMFDSTANGTYLNEDSFFLPPDFGKDPQNDWPITPPAGNSGGYTEGCCDGAGWLFFPSVGDPTRISGNDTNNFEGNFLWNDLLSSQFLNPTTQGDPGVRFQYEVTPDKIGVPLSFTIGSREGGLAIDMFLFSTSPDLMTTYTQEQLDQLILTPMSVQLPTDVVVTPSNTWSYLKMEGESYASKTADESVGFTRSFAGDSRTGAMGTQILAPDTTASQGAALFTQTGFSLFADKATYYVQFARTGTYYMYMRFTMFDNSGNGTYLNEDSFFLPPDFGKDPQNDWPITPPAGNSGGYTEGCCAGAGWLFFPSVGDPTRISGNDTNNFEGNFLWNDLLSSQFLNPTTQGDPAVRFQYEVTSTNVGVPLSFTIGSREGGLAVDMFLFSTSPDLMTTYTQAQLEALLISAPLAITSISASGGNVTINWAGDTGVRLQKTTTVAVPASWADIPSTLGNSSHSEPVTSTPTFFRLAR